MKRFYSTLLAAVVASVSFAQSVPGYVPANGLQAWYSFTGNTADGTANHHDLTNNGAVLTTDRCGNPNSAYAFNGISSYLSSSDHFFDNGWTNFSISLWFKTDTNSNPYNTNHSQTMFNTNPHYGTELSMSWGGSTNKVDFFYSTTPSNTQQWNVFSNNAALSTSTVAKHVWNHLVMVKSGTTYKMYLNGALDATFNNSAVAPSSLCSIYIGTISGGFIPETFMGSLDDYGIWNRDLSPAEVLQLYQNGCNTCVMPGGMIAWYPFNGNSMDEAYHGHDLISHGPTLTTDRCGHANSAYYFDGDTTYFSSIDTFFDNGWLNSTITLWFNTDTTRNPYNGNYSQTMFNTYPHYGSEISMSWGGSTSKVDYFYDNNPGDFGAWDVFSNNAALSNSVITTHTWTHVALVRDSGSYQMYINGVLDNTFTGHGTSVSYLCQVLIGNISEYGNETFWGSLDDIGIWDRSLSASEVADVYNACCVSTTGINDVAPVQKLYLYPNPANNLLTVRAESDMPQGTLYTITDMTGRTVLTGEMTGQSTQIAVGQLAPAIYVIRIGDTGPAVKFVKE